MAHFACVSLPYLGHLDPMAALARELTRRGHQATVLGIRDVAPIAARLGLPFVPLGRLTHPPGWLETAARHLGAVDGLRRLGPAMRDFASLTAMLCEELPAVLRRLSVDMILTDQYEAAGALVGYHLGIPFISLAAALPLNWEPGIPSPFVGWPYGETRWHAARNTASAYGAKTVRAPITDVVAAYAARWRLGRGRQIEDYMSGFAQISQLVRGLDYPRRALIGCFHYCGPLREPRVGAPAGPRTRTGRAFASLGTLQGHRAAVFARIAEATRACGLELTIAHGGRLPGPEAASLARHAEVHAFVDQHEALAAADVAILHGGLNTVLDALCQGVPMVVMPLAFEQGAIAARVARAGAGRVFARRGSRRRLTGLIRDVHDTAAYADRAAALREEMRTAGGVRRAADIVEHVVTTGRPCFTDQPLPEARPSSANDALAAG